MTRRKLALFDLDNTLLETDSDYQWAQFLIEEGILEEATYKERNQYFYDRYMDGTLDIHEFLDFQLRPLVNVLAPGRNSVRAAPRGIGVTPYTKSANCPTPTAVFVRVCTTFSSGFDCMFG